MRVALGQVDRLQHRHLPLHHLATHFASSPPNAPPFSPPAPTQAFYIPLDELPRWAQTHPEYSPAAVLALTGCIAESSGMKRRDKAALMAAVEGELRAAGLLGGGGGGPGGANGGLA